ncbi:MAG: glycosyltransferase family 4 protein [Elusimicrobiales bacterium]
MRNSLRILSLIDIPWYSGLTEYALVQARALREVGHNVFFAIPGENKIFNEIANDFETIKISGREKILRIKDIISISKLINNKKIDIINAHTGRTQTLAYLISLINKPIKIIRTKADAKQIKKSFTYSKVLCIICGSKYIENMYKNAGIKIKTQTVYLSYPAVKTKEIKEEKPFRITIVGRLDPVKGHINFIKAGLLILEKRKDVEFIIAGKESNIKWKDLAQIIPDKFKRYFRYYGFVEDVYSLMAESHIGVISSIGSEAVSRVAIEWMNSQRAVISSNAGCLVELFEPDYIYPKESFIELADKIEKNLNFERIKRIGMDNKKRFNEIFSFENLQNKTSEIFENL